MMTNNISSDSHKNDIKELKQIRDEKLRQAEKIIDPTKRHLAKAKIKVEYHTQRVATKWNLY